MRMSLRCDARRDSDVGPLLLGKAVSDSTETACFLSLETSHNAERVGFDTFGFVSQVKGHIYR